MTGRVRDPNGTDESVAMAGVGSNQRTSLYSHEMSMNHYEEIHAMRLPNIPTEQPEYLQIIAEWFSQIDETLSTFNVKF